MAEIATEVASTVGAVPSAEFQEPSSPPSPPRDLKKGDDVYCFHGPSLYLARIVDVRLKEEKTQCLIHYFGWKKVYDEWLDTDSKRLVPVNSKRLKQNSEFIVHIRKAPYASKTVQHLAKFVKEDDIPKKTGSESPNVHSGLEKLETDKPRSPKVRSSSSSTHSTKSNKENTEGSSSQRKHHKSEKKKSHSREGDSEEKLSHLKKHKKKSSEKDRHRSEKDKHRAERAKHGPEKEKPRLEKEAPCPEKETPCPEKKTPGAEKEKLDQGKEKPNPEKEKSAPDKEKPGPQKEKEHSLEKEKHGLVAEELLSDKLQKERPHKHRDKPHKEKRHKDKDREKKRHSSSHHGKHKERSSLPGLDVDKVKKIWDQLLSRRIEPSRDDTADVAEASPQQKTPDAPKKEPKPSEKTTEMQAEKPKLQQKAVEGSKGMNFDWAIKALPCPSEEPKKKREGKKEAGDKNERVRAATSSKETRQEKNPGSGNEKKGDVAASRQGKDLKISESSEKKKEKLSSSGEGNGGLKIDDSKKKEGKIRESIAEKAGKVGEVSKEKTHMSLSARKISESDTEKLSKKHEGKSAPKEKDPKKAAREKDSRKRKLDEDSKGSQDAAAALAQLDPVKNSSHQSSKADEDPKDENNRKRKKRRLHTDSETSSSSFVSEAASSTSRVHPEAKGIRDNEKMIASEKDKGKKAAADKEKEKKVAADEEKEKKVVAEKEKKKKKKIAEVKPEKPANTKKQIPASEKEHEKQKDLSGSELEREKKVEEKVRLDGELQEKQKPFNRSKDEQQKEGRARPAKEGKERKLSASSEPSLSASREETSEKKAGLDPHTSGAELVEPSSAMKKKPVAEVIPQTMQPSFSVSVSHCINDPIIQKVKDLKFPASEEKEPQKRLMREGKSSPLDDVVRAAKQAKERSEAAFKSLVMSAEATLETPSTPLLEKLEESDKRIVIMGKAEWEEHQLRKLLREQERRKAVEKELKKVKERTEKAQERSEPTHPLNVLEKSLKTDSASSKPPGSERVATKRPKTPSEEPEPSEPKRRRVETRKQPPTAIASTVKETFNSQNVQVETSAEPKPQPALKEEKVEEEVPAPEIPPQPSSSVLASPLMRTASHVTCPSPATPDSPLRAPVPPLVHRSLVFPEEYKQQGEVKEEAVEDKPKKEENIATATEDTVEEMDEEYPVEDYDSEEDFTEGMEVIDEVGDDDVEVGDEEEPVRPPPVKRRRGRPKRIVRVRLEIPPEFAILMVRDDERCKASAAVEVRAAPVPVNEILRRYLGSKTDLIPLRARVVRGAVSVLKELFDMALPTRLLYVTERESHRALMERLKKPPGDVYGGIYLLRLLCSEYSKLVAYCMNYREMDERKAVLMMHYIYDIVAYMREEFREWYDGPEDDIDEIYEKIDAFEPEEDSSEEDSDEEEEEEDSDEEGEMNGDGYDEDSEEGEEDDESDGEEEPVRRSSTGRPRFRVVNGGYHGNGEH